jgi:hypothetical protein
VISVLNENIGEREREKEGESNKNFSIPAKFHLNTHNTM